MEGEMIEVPQIDTSSPVPHGMADAKAMAITGNNNIDLANIAKEMGVTLDARGNVVENPAPAAQPVPTPAPAPVAPAPAPVQAADPKPVDTTVPPKFLKPDGTVDEAKVEKSTKSVEEMIAHYRAKEREAQQLQNRVNNPPAQPQAAPQPVPQAAPQIAPNAPLNQLERDIATAIFQDAAAMGAPIAEGHAIALARAQIRVAEIKYAAEMDATKELRARVEDNERRRELQGLIDANPELLSAEMADTLWRVRQENPWLNQAPEPWKAALIHLQGTQGRAGQVQTPIPTGVTAKAPATPVTPVARVQPTVNLANPHSMTNEQLEAEIRKQFPRFRGK